MQLQTGEKEQDFSLLPIQVSISVQLWRLPGCHEFLAALGESAANDESCPHTMHHFMAPYGLHILQVTIVVPIVCVQDLTCARLAKKKWF